MSVTRVSKIDYVLGEGPHWNEATGSLLCVDIDKAEVHDINVSTGETTVHKIPGATYIGFVVPCKENPSIWAVALDNTISLYNSATRQVEKTLTDVSKDSPVSTRINDGKADPRGNLFFGTIITGADLNQSTKKVCNLYCLTTKGDRMLIHDGVGLSNGLAWTKDCKKMFYADSIPERYIYQFDYNPDVPVITNKQVFIDFKTDKRYQDCEYIPDGMAIDTEDHLWVASFRSSCVLEIDSTTGDLIRKIDIPSRNTTSVCFGGSDFKDLFVTSADGDLHSPEPVKPHTPGAVYKVTGLRVQGKPGDMFGGSTK